MNMRSILTKEILDKMIEDYNYGTGLADLSEKYEFQKQTIQKHFKTKGIRITKGSARRFEMNELNSIIRDYNNGMRPIDLGEKYNRNPTSIIGKLKDLNIYKDSTHRFTDDEIEFLQIHYPLGNWDLILKKIPTSKQSIHTKMSKLGISATSYFDKSRWTKEEIDILFKHYKYGNLQTISELLPNRTYSAIRSKAERMNLQTRFYWSDDEIRILKEFYPICSLNEMMKKLPRRSRETIIVKASEYNLKNVCKYQDWEIDFIVNNWETMSDKDIAIHLNKPYRGIIGKRLAMGLLRIKEDSCYEDICDYLRHNNLFWKKASMKSCNYQCVLTGKRFSDIHHIYGFNKIVAETISILNLDITKSIDSYTDKELREILDTFRIIQNQYPLGVCLTKELHMLFHNQYGYGDNTEEQWIEFKNTYCTKNVA